ERARVQKRPTENLEAYDLYLRATQMAPTNGEENERTIKLLEQAIALDPHFAAAKAALAYRIFFQAFRAGDNQGLDHAITVANEAAQMDTMLASPHFVLGTVFSSRGRDAQSRLAFMRALELNPNDTNVMANLSVNESLFGRLDESLLWARRMFALSAHI